MYIICVILCLFSALSRRVGALQISIIIIIKVKLLDVLVSNLSSDRSVSFAQLMDGRHLTEFFPRVSIYDQYLTVDATKHSFLPSCFQISFRLFPYNNYQYLTTDATKTLISAIMLSGLNYCSTMPSGVPQYGLDMLQRVRNGAARLTIKVPNFPFCTHSTGFERQVEFNTN